MEINILIWIEYLKSIDLNLWRNTIVKIQSCLHLNIDFISAEKLTKWELHSVFSQTVHWVKKELIKSYNKHPQTKMILSNKPYMKTSGEHGV